MNDKKRIPTMEETIDFMAHTPFNITIISENLQPAICENYCRFYHALNPAGVRKELEWPEECGMCPVHNFLN